MTDLAALKREARHATTAPKRLLELAALGPELARVVARSIGTPPEVLAQLASHADPKTRQYVAENPATPREVLSELAGDPSRAVQGEVARNPNAAEDTQVALYGLAVPSIRKALANKRPVPARVQRLFAASDDWQERLLMAQCHDLIPELVPLLASDGRPEVREALAFYHAEQVSQDFLDSFATHTNASLRGRVAQHSHNAGMLQLLAHDKEPVVAELAAQNPNFDNKAPNMTTQQAALQAAVSARDLSQLRAYAAEYNLLPPPWVILPHAHPVSIGWRMGYGESFIDLWGEWWDTRSYTEAEQVEYFRQFAPPYAWLEWVIFTLWPDIEDTYFEALEEDETAGEAILKPYFARLEALGFGSYADWKADYEREDWQ